MNDKYYEFLSNASAQAKRGKTWAEITKEYNEIFGENLSENALSKRVRRYRKSNGNSNKNISTKTKSSLSSTPTGEYTTRYDNGTIEAVKIVKYSKEIFGDDEKLLTYLGYDPSRWQFAFVQSSVWEQGDKNKYAVKFRLKPRTDLATSDYIKAFVAAIERDIKPLEVESSEPNLELNPDRLMEFCPVELHMGKLSHRNETGEDYDLSISKRAFRSIIDRTVKKQREEKCGRCLVVIGSDFFNSESDNMTTGKTPQQNDTRYKKLFEEGIALYTEALLTFKKEFNEVDVILCSGNHARAMEYFLYVSLSLYFRNDDVINFKRDYKDTQAYRFGNCAIFYNHGDANLARTIKSIPAEFYEIWGKTIYRELHLGHLHKEVTVDDDSGMITRRIGSPCATDAWHYQNRFVGATKKHQVFIWNKNTGLENIYYIPNLKG